MEVNVGVSKNHVHLTEAVFLTLFGNKPLVKRNDLNQPGQFASIETVDLENNGKRIEHVRVVGPFRNYNQVELCESDAELLCLDLKRRQSGDLEDASSITIIGPMGNVNLDKCVIMADAHIHMSERLANNLGLKNKEKVKIYELDNYIMDAVIKTSKLGNLELHIDTDEAKIYNLNSDSKVEFKICGK